MMFNVLLPLNIAIILIIIEITKIIAPGKYQKLKVSVVIDVRKYGCKTYKNTNERDNN